MNKEKGIKDILSSLSPEERELHKDLIDECMQRELDVEKHSKNIKENFEKLNKISAKIVTDFDTLLKTTEYINNILSDSQEKITNYSNIDLRFIPEEEFVKA